MKNFLFLLCCVLGIFPELHAQRKSCCPTGDFAALAGDSAFLASHPDPLPSARNGKGVTIRYKTDDGSEAQAYEIRASKPTKKVLFIFHEWWGLNGHIKQEAERLQQELGDVTVYALDLYDGKTAGEAKDAARLMQSVSEERVRSIILGLAKYVGKDTKIASVGWCFGGTWTMQAALMLGDQMKGSVIYYGMPEVQPAKLKSLKAGILGIFAKRDKWITPQIVSGFKTAMKKVNKTLSVKSYDADHAFANPSNPKYDREFAEDAHNEALAFLRSSLNE